MPWYSKAENRKPENAIVWKLIRKYKNLLWLSGKVDFRARNIAVIKNHIDLVKKGSRERDPSVDSFKIKEIKTMWEQIKTRQP